jgi:hypothetical protein
MWLGNWTHNEPTWAQHAAELRDIRLDGPSVGDMMEDDARIDEIKAADCEDSEIGGGVYDEGDTFDIPVQPLRVSDLFSEMSTAEALLEAVRERARHTAETAAEVEGAPALLRMPELGGSIHQSVGIGRAGGKEASSWSSARNAFPRGQDLSAGVQLGNSSVLFVSFPAARDRPVCSHGTSGLASLTGVEWRT